MKCIKLQPQDYDLQKWNIPSQYLMWIFSVQENGRELARAALYDNPYISEDTLQVGAYHCEDKSHISTLLFSEIIKEAKFLGAKTLIGPMNGSTWENYRFACNNKNRAFLLEPINKDYYIKQWEEIGFKEYAEYYSSISAKNKLTRTSYIEEKLNQRFSANGIYLQKYEKENKSVLLRQLVEFSNCSFAKNDFFSPASKKYFLKKYNQLLSVLDTKYIYFAIQENNIVGMLFCYPDNTQQKKTIITKTLARHPGEAYKGLGWWLMQKMLSETQADGYKNHIHALMKMDNASIKLSKRLGGQVFRKYYLYKMKIA